MADKVSFLLSSPSSSRTEMADTFLPFQIGGKVDVLIGKATKNEAKVVEGEIKQTEGKAGVANAGLGGNNTSATGTHGTTGTHY